MPDATTYCDPRLALEPLTDAGLDVLVVARQLRHSPDASAGLRVTLAAHLSQVAELAAQAQLSLARQLLPEQGQQQLWIRGLRPGRGHQELYPYHIEAWEVRGGQAVARILNERTNGQMLGVPLSLLLAKACSADEKRLFPDPDIL